MTMDLRAGTRVGDYILDSYVGGGSFGAVWRGHEANGGRPVAIKFLTGALSSSETAAMRADVELLAASAASRSQHVVHVLGGGVEPVPHIVMEYVEGIDLQALLKEKGRLSSEETIEVGLAIADALAALNEAGIIHRDIKPANVMMDKDGVKLTDFGIAKIVGYDTMTMTGQAAMTMAYAAPEIWDEGSPFGRPSHRSDLYAMGVLLYQCITGDTPFRGNYGALYKAHMERSPDINALPADTPPSLRGLIRRCLEKKQQDRPQDAAECVAMLQRAKTEAFGVAEEANEPRQLGPWVKLAPHQTQPWAWYCRHESRNVEATVEVHFADSLEYSAILRRALAANGRLTQLGAERLIESNRLLLHPNESWHNPPPGRFQFWVAREERNATPANLVSLPIAKAGVVALAGLVRAAAEEGLSLALRDNLVLQADGSIHLRRPGLATPPDDDASQAGLAYLRSLPLEAAARAFLGSDESLEALASVAAQPDATSTIVLPNMPHPSDTVFVNTQAPAAAAAPVTPQPAAVPPAFAAAALAATALQLQLNRSNTAPAASWYDLTLRNSSQRHMDLRLEAFDDAQALAFSMPRQVSLAPGASDRVRIHVQPHKRRLIGGKRRRRFTVMASGGGGEPPARVDGEFEDEASKLPLLLGGGSLGIAAFAVAGLMAFAGGDSEGGGSDKVALAPTATVEAVAIAQPTPTPEPPPPTPEPPPPTPEPPPPPPPEPNRANCNLIRASGTYLSESERVWFQTNCIAVPGGGGNPPANTGGGNPPPATNTNTGGGNPPPPPPPPPTPVPPRPSIPAQKTSTRVGLTITGGHGSTHRVGAQLTLCYTSLANQRIRIYDTTKPGSPFRQGVDDGTGECFAITLDETGVDSVRIDALNAAGAVVDYAQLSIIVQ
jgi:hypothetical protein